jgi:hypothetical protein
MVPTGSSSVVPVGTARWACPWPPASKRFTPRLTPDTSPARPASGTKSSGLRRKLICSVRSAFLQRTNLCEFARFVTDTTLTMFFFLYKLSYEMMDLSFFFLYKLSYKMFFFLYKLSYKMFFFLDKLSYKMFVFLYKLLYKMFFFLYKLLYKLMADS